MTRFAEGAAVGYSACKQRAIVASTTGQHRRWQTCSLKASGRPAVSCPARSLQGLPGRHTACKLLGQRLARKLTCGRLDLQACNTPAPGGVLAFPIINSTTPNNHHKERGLTCGRLDLHIVHGLHQPRRGHEEGRVADAARGGDHLAAAAVQRLCGAKQNAGTGMRQVRCAVGSPRNCGATTTGMAIDTAF